MAKDDYFVIVYKILTYFYECLKAGKKPQAEDYAAILSGDGNTREIGNRQ